MSRSFPLSVHRRHSHRYLGLPPAYQVSIDIDTSCWLVGCPPCQPRRPEHKSVVEGDIKYVKRNLLPFLPLFREAQRERGHETPDAGELATDWSAGIVRATKSMSARRSVALRLELFESEEALAVRPLPMTRWDPVVCKELSVGPDRRVQLENVFDTVPYRLIGERLLVLGDSRMVLHLPWTAGACAAALGAVSEADSRTGWCNGPGAWARRSRWWHRRSLPIRRSTACPGCVR